ncbi:phosphotransferase family protein [Cryptosporangium japonicum]|uniref:Aminoglycoside phosphotransferase n=1 Tax=Cryptosporangium japonicum TaxID=80872 RepID=A0ABP3DHY6_9ACTN
MTDVHEALRARLSHLWGHRVTVSEPQPLTGGASRETLRVTVHHRDTTRDLVLRRDLIGQPDGLARETAALRAAATAGVPVPTVVDDGPTLAGHPYLLMGHVHGETLPQRLLRDDTYAAVRTTLADTLGALAARIHTINPDHIPDLPHPDPLTQLRDIADADPTPRPAVELGLAWLTRHRPPPRHPTVVHGDLRNGNVLIGPEGLRAVLDWELVHHGDPTEDLGWLCVKAWRFGTAPPVGGYGTRDQLLAGYHRVAGWAPTPDQLHWWEVYGTLRWALLCRAQTLAYLRGTRDTLEHAVIGRRVCEAEYDLLLALGHTTPHPADDVLRDLPPRTHTTPPHDAPDATHLLTALGDTLTAGNFGDTYTTRLAANALKIARREILLGPTLTDRHHTRLRTLGLPDDTALAAAARTTHPDPAIITAIADTLRDKLLVANPRYLGQPAD